MSVGKQARLVPGAITQMVQSPNVRLRMPSPTEFAFVRTFLNFFISLPDSSLVHSTVWSRSTRKFSSYGVWISLLTSTGHAC